MIGIIGQGFVGKAVKESFKNYYEILTFDKDKRKSNTESLNKLVSKCRIIFTCLPTPMNENGSCHLDIVEGVLNEIGIANNLLFFLHSIYCFAIASSNFFVNAYTYIEGLSNSS